MTDPMVEWMAHVNKVQARLDAVIPDMRTSMEVLRGIREKTNAQIGPGDTKDLARQLINVERAIIDMCRAIKGDYNSDAQVEFNLTLNESVGTGDALA